MNLELCKRLFELKPEWKNDDSISGYEWHRFRNDGKPSKWGVRLKPFVYTPNDEIVPCYDLEYLLEKLPTNSSDAENNDQFRMTVEFTPKGWKAFYHFGRPMMHEYADTPLEAVLRLAIKLAEEGLV